MAVTGSDIDKIVNKHIKGDYLLGFSLLEGLLPRKYKSLIYGITVGIRLDDKIIDMIKSGPTLDYLKHYNKINSTLNKIAFEIKDEFNAQRRKAEVILATLEPEKEKDYPDYLKTLAVDFPHKTAATRSGLGWIGKTALFVSPKYGPRLRLVTVLTTQKFETGPPVKTSLCGQCDLCVKKCPANAANGKLWVPGMLREDFFDAHACRAKARELSKTLLRKDETVCGICMAVCPLGGEKR